MDNKNIKTMKKVSLYLMMALAGWSLTACDESHNDYAQPDVFPQEELVTIDGFEATPTAEAAAVIDLGAMTEDAIQLFTLKQGTLPEGVTVENIRLEAWPADKGQNVATNVAATEDGMVTKEELAKLVYTFYGKKSTVRTFTAKLFANAFLGKEAQLITLGDFTLQIKPEELENPYYYVYGNAIATSIKDAYKTVMTPDPNSDVVFSYTTYFIKNGDINVWNSKYWTEEKDKSSGIDFTKLYGSGEEKGASYYGETGKLAQGEENKKPSISSPTKGYYTFTVNLEDLTYEWKLLDDQNPASYTSISIIGVDNDWDNDIDMVGADYVSGIKKLNKTTSSHNWYVQLTLNADTQLKFRANHAWEIENEDGEKTPTNWGYGASTGDWTVDEDAWAKACDKGGGNIVVPAGTYHVYFCDITGTAHFVPVE